MADQPRLAPCGAEWFSERPGKPDCGCGWEDLCTRPNDVAAWLNTLPRTSAIPAVVRIGRTTYQGAYYTQERDVSEGTRAYSEGKRTYKQTMLYLLGELPASYRRSSNIAYRFEDSARRWYLAGYFDQEDSNEWHPFGRMFQLAPDDAEVTTKFTNSGEPYPEMQVQLVAS